MSRCSDCDGVGFKEYDAGLVQIGCKICEMTGKVDCDLTKEEFEKAYAFRSDMTVAQVAELGLVAAPSSEEGGWAMVKAEEVPPEANKPTHLIIPQAIEGKTTDETVQVARQIIEVGSDEVEEVASLSEDSLLVRSEFATKEPEGEIEVEPEALPDGFILKDEDDPSNGGIILNMKVPPNFTIPPYTKEDAAKDKAAKKAESAKQNRVLKPTEYKCSKCSKPGKTIIHRKSGKGIGHKHQEFKK